jgi:hypothetical protein
MSRVSFRCKTGASTHGGSSLRRLAATRNQVIVDLNLPLVVHPGLCCLPQMPTAMPNFVHVLAIEEDRIASYPDRQRSYADCNILALVEFQSFRA